MENNDQKKPKEAKAPQGIHPSHSNANKSENGIALAKKVGVRVSSTLGKYAGKVVTYALNIILTLVLIGIITGSAIACALVVYIKNYVDPVYDIDNLKYDSDLTTFLYYEQKNPDGTSQWVEWEDERIHGQENRMWVSYEEMPEDLINAFVSIEDKRFFTHKGIDVRRTVGAILGFMTGNDSYGGSTITQQLIKNVTGEDDVTIQRKIQEILRALNLESKRSKEEILEMYLNTIYLHKGCYGVSAAAYEYFGKEVSELTLVECAALASIPQNPSKWNPISHPDLNEERRWTVLEEMYKNTDIEKTYTLEEIRAAQDAQLVLRQESGQQTVSKIHSWFVDTVMDDVIADLMSTYHYDEQTAANLLYSGGLKIYTTIDRNIQDKLDAIYNNNDLFPSKGTGVQVESAMTIIDQRTGNIVAIIGGRGAKDTARGFNRATMAKRQPGSSIKPLSAYSIAIERGLINYSSVLDDTPFRAEEDGTLWPNNWNNKFDGLVTVSQAVRDSKNTIAVKVVDQVGTRNVYDFLTQKYRLSTLLESDIDYAPLALGGFTEGVTTRDMCGAYAAIANNGIYNEPRTYTKVTDSTGNILLDSSSAITEVILSSDTCAVTTRLMQEVVTAGTGTAVSLRRQVDVAGKTGTTQNDRDLYFCGFTPYYTAACWVGYDNPQSLTGFTSGQRSVAAATYIWDQVMTSIHSEIIAAGNVKTFSQDLTKNLITRTYCKDSGLLAGPNCSADLRGNRTATGFYTYSNVPTATCDCHVMVSYCNDTGLVAGPECTNVREVALLDVQRSFPIEVTIADAQYTYRKMTGDIPYAKNNFQPYYWHTLEKGTYPGTSSVPKAANGFCANHNPTLCQ